MFCGRKVKTSWSPECISSLKHQSICLKHMSTLNVHTPHTYCPGLHCYYRSKSFTSGKTLAGALNDKDDSKKNKIMFSVIFSSRVQSRSTKNGCSISSFRTAALLCLKLPSLTIKALLEVSVQWKG